MTLTFKAVPGWENRNVHVEGPLNVIAAALKQICDYPNGALTGLDKLEVKES